MNESTKNLIHLLLTDSDPDIRRRAAEDLSGNNDRNVLAALSTALEDENKGVADAVSRSLLSIGGEKAARSLVHHIGDENITSRNLAAKLLVKLRNASVHAIVPYLRDADKDIRKLAVDILGEIRSKEPISYLLPLLKDSDPNVLVSTIEAVGNIGSREAVKPLFQAYEQYPFVRIIAIEALGKIGSDSVRDYLESKYRDAINAGNAEDIFLFALLDALGILGDSQTLEMLLANYDAIGDPLRDVLLHVIVQIIERHNLEYQLDNKVRKDLLHALHSDNYEIQLSAAKGLVQFNDSDVTKELLLSLGISEEMDCVVVAQMLVRPRVFQIAVECLEMHKMRISRGTIQIVLLLGKLTNEYIRAYKGFRGYRIAENELERAFTLITEVWEDSNQEDWEILADTLLRIDCDRAAEFLQKVMINMDPWSRVHMIDRLIVMPTRRALECIARFAEDDNEMVRDAALMAFQVAGIPIEAITSPDENSLFDRGKN
jgi:HEAT repeat protein